MNLSIVKEDVPKRRVPRMAHLSDGAASTRPADVRGGGKDQAGRDIVDVFWATQDYAIYRWHKATPEQAFFGNGKRIHHSYGISPLFGNTTQQKRFALMGSVLARPLAASPTHDSR